MTSLLWLALLVVVFAASRWSGRQLDHHYADRVELAAVGLLGLSVIGPIALGAGSASLAGVPVALLLAFAVVGGLAAPVARAGRDASKQIASGTPID